MKSGKCPYCDHPIIQQKDCYKCGNFLCDRSMTFEDVRTSVDHFAKSSQQKSTLAQSTVFGPSQTNVSYGNSNSSPSKRRIGPKFLVPYAEPTKTEQSALNKLSDKDYALEYLLYYFYFILFLDTLTKLKKKNCIECDTDLKRIKFPKGRIWMKCLNRDCSLCYVLTKDDSTYDIDRWRIKGKNKIKKIIKNEDVQVFFFFFF
jgi:hypothetical protein